MKTLYSIIILFSIISCNNPREKFKTHISSRQLKSEISIDTLFLENESFSGKGFFKIIDSNIVFFDDSYYLLTFYDDNGKYLKNVLGLGDKKNEISGYKFHVRTKDKENIFFDTEYSIKQYDENYNSKEKIVKFNWAKRKNIYDSYVPEDEGMYDFNWDYSEYSNRSLSINTKNQIYIPINIISRISPEVNKFTKSETYFSNTHTIGIMNSSTGRLEKVFGNFPDIYLESKYLSIFAYNYMNIKNDSLYVTYSADSSIYVYDKENKPSFKFGRPGLGMKNDYLLAKNLDFYMDNFKNAQKSYGYYTSIYVDNDFVFRSYTKSNEDLGGLQIYKNNDLIYDFNVSKRFNVIGKIDGWYYADGIIDEENSFLGVFKFKIK